MKTYLLPTSVLADACALIRSLNIAHSAEMTPLHRQHNPIDSSVSAVPAEES
ncbi:hypothetical protein ACFWC5_37840 [Streptomyces sp. NPDC060085]|uniref:hypothetical protein n=1 Tax=Streptomyces sp. NPDC060085 TaxID=3347054 RepID=UPI0036689E1E